MDTVKLKGLESYSNDIPLTRSIYSSAKLIIGDISKAGKDALDKNELTTLTDDDIAKIAIYKELEKKIDEYVKSTQIKKVTDKSFEETITLGKDIAEYIVKSASFLDKNTDTPDTKNLFKNVAYIDNLPDNLLNHYDNASEKFQDKIDDTLDKISVTKIEISDKEKTDLKKTYEQSIDRLNTDIKDSITEIAKAKKDAATKTVSSKASQTSTDILADLVNKSKKKLDEQISNVDQTEEINIGKTQREQYDKTKLDISETNSKIEQFTKDVDTINDEVNKGIDREEQLKAEIEAIRPKLLAEKNPAKKTELSEQRTKYQKEIASILKEREQLENDRINKPKEIELLKKQVSKLELQLKDFTVLENINENKLTIEEQITLRTNPQVFLDLLRKNYEITDEQFVELYKEKIPKDLQDKLLKIEPTVDETKSDTLEDDTDKKAKQKKAFDELPKNIQARLETVEKIKPIRDRIIAEKQLEVDAKNENLKRLMQNEIDQAKAEKTARIMLLDEMHNKALAKKAARLDVEDDVKEMQEELKTLEERNAKLKDQIDQQNDKLDAILKRYKKQSVIDEKSAPIEALKATIQEELKTNSKDIKDKKSSIKKYTTDFKELEKQIKLEASMLNEEYKRQKEQIENSYDDKEIKKKYNELISQNKIDNEEVKRLVKEESLKLFRKEDELNKTKEERIKDIKAKKDKPFVETNAYLSKIFDGNVKKIGTLESDTPKYDKNYKLHNLYNPLDFEDDLDTDSKIAKRNGIWVKLQKDDAYAKVYKGKIVAVYGNIETPELAKSIKLNNLDDADRFYKTQELKADAQKFAKEQQRKLQQRIETLTDKGIKEVNGKPLDQIKSLSELPKATGAGYKRNEDRETQVKRFTREERIGNTIVKTGLTTTGDRYIKEIVNYDDTKKSIPEKSKDKIKRIRQTQFDLIKDKTLSYRGDVDSNDNRVSKGKFHNVKYNIDGKEIELRVKLEDYMPKDKSYYKLDSYHRPIDIDEESRRKLILEFGIENEKDYKKLLNQVYSSKGEHELLSLAEKTKQTNQSILDIEKYTSKNAMDMIKHDYYKGNIPKTISNEDNTRLAELHDNFMRRAKTQGKFVNKVDNPQDPLLAQDIKTTDLTKIEYHTDIEKTLEQLPYSVKMYKGTIVDIDLGDNDPQNKLELIRQTQAIITKHYHLLIEQDPIQREYIKNLDVNSKELLKLQSSSLNKFIEVSKNTYLDMKPSSETKDRITTKDREKPDDFLKQFKEEQDRKIRQQLQREEEERLLKQKLENDAKKRDSRKRVAKQISNRIQSNNQSIRSKLMQSNDILAEISKLPLDSKKIPVLKAQKKKLDAQVLRQKTENEIYTMKLERYVDVINPRASSENLALYHKFDKARKILQYQGKEPDTINNDFDRKLDKLNTLESAIYGKPTGKIDPNTKKPILTLGLEAQVKMLENEYNLRLEIINQSYGEFIVGELSKSRTSEKAELSREQKKKLIAQELSDNITVDLTDTRKLYEVKLSLIASIKLAEESYKKQRENIDKVSPIIKEELSNLKKEKRSIEQDIADSTDADEKKALYEKLRAKDRELSTKENELSSLEFKAKATQASISDKKAVLVDLSYVDKRDELEKARKELQNAKKSLRTLQDEITSTTKGMTLEEAQKVYNEYKDERINGVNISSIQNEKQAIKAFTVDISSKEHLVEMARRHKLRGATATAVSSHIELARQRNQTKLEQFKMLEYAKNLVAKADATETNKVSELLKKTEYQKKQIDTIDKIYTEIKANNGYNKPAFVGAPITMKVEYYTKLRDTILPMLTPAQMEEFEKKRYITDKEQFLQSYLDELKSQNKQDIEEQKTLLTKELNADKNELKLNYRDALGIIKNMEKYQSEEDILLEDKELVKALQQEVQDNQQDIKDLVTDLNSIHKDSITIDTLIKKQQVVDHRQNIERVMQAFDREKNELMKRYEQEKIDIARVIQDKVLQQKSITDRVVKELKASDQSPISSLTNMIETGLTKDMVLKAMIASSSDRSSSAGFINTVKKAGVGKDKTDEIDTTIGEKAPIRFNDKPKGRAGDQTIDQFRKSFLNSVFSQILESHIPTKPEDIEAFKVYNGIDIPTQDIIDNIEKYKQAMIDQFLEVQNTLSTEKRAKDGKGDPSWKATSDDVKNSMSMFTNKFFLDVSDQAAELQKTEGTKYSQDPVENQNMLLAELLEKRLKTHIEQFFNPKIHANPPKLNVNAEYDSIMQQLFTHSKNSEGFQKLSEVTQQMNVVDEKAEIQKEIDRLNNEADEKIKQLEDERKTRQDQLKERLDELLEGKEEYRNRKIREKAIDDYRKYVLKNKVIPEQSYSLANTLYTVTEQMAVKPEFRNVSMGNAYINNIQSVGKQLVKMNNILLERYLKLYRDDFQITEQTDDGIKTRSMTVEDIRNSTNLVGKHGDYNLYTQLLYDTTLSRDKNKQVILPDGKAISIMTYSKKLFSSAIQDNVKNAKSITPVIINNTEKQYDLAKNEHKGIMALLQLYGDNAGTMNYVDMQYLELANNKLKTLSSDVYDAMFHKVLGIYTTIPTLSPDMAFKLANVAMQKIMDKIITSDVHELKKLNSGIDIVDTIYSTLRSAELYQGTDNDKDAMKSYQETEKLIKEMSSNGVFIRELFDDPTLLDDVLDISEKFWVDSVDSDLNYLPEAADQAELKRLLRAYQSIVNNNDFNSKKTKDFFEQSAKTYVDNIISYMDIDILKDINDPTLSEGSHESQLVKDIVYNTDNNTQTFTYNGKEYTVGSITDSELNPNQETFVAEPDKMSEFISKSMNISTMTGVKGFNDLANTLFTIIDSGIPTAEMEQAIRDACAKYMIDTIQNIVDTHKDLIKGTVIHNLAKFNKSYSKEYVDQLVNKYTLQLLEETKNNISNRIGDFTTNVADYMINLSYSQSTLGTEQANLDRIASKQDFLRKFLLGEKDSNQPSLIDLFKNPTDTSSLPQTLRSQNLMSQFITQITNEIYDSENVQIVRWKLSPIHRWQGGREICEKFAMTHELPQDILLKAQAQGISLEGLKLRSNTPSQLHAHCMCYTVPVYIK